MRKVSDRTDALKIATELAREAIKAIESDAEIKAGVIVIETTIRNGGRVVAFTFKQPQEIEFIFSPIKIICNSAQVKAQLVKIIRNMIKVGEVKHENTRAF